MGRKVIEVTGRIGFKLVGDRLHATVPSGDGSTTYSIKFPDAEAAAVTALAALAERHCARVIRFPRKGSPLPHG